MAKFEFNDTELSKEQKDKINQDLKNKSGIIGDAKNAWTAMDIAVQLQDSKDVVEVGLILDYEKYLQRKNLNPLAVEYILAKSNKSGIEKFNALVAEFNLEFPNMQKGDFSKAKEILKQVYILFERAK